MSENTSLLESLEIDAQGVTELAARLLEEGAENAGHTLAALHLPDLSERLDALYEDTLDMRRPHLAVLVATIDHAHRQLTDVLDSTALDYWVPQEMLDKAHEGMRITAEALAEVVGALQVRDRRRD